MYGVEPFPATGDSGPFAARPLRFTAFSWRGGGEGARLARMHALWLSVCLAVASAVLPARPVARSGHAMVFDARRGAVLLIGGDHDLVGAPGDVWAWSRPRRRAVGGASSGTLWHRVETEAPPSRTLAAVAYDTRRGVLVLQGGLGDGDTAYGDTQEWDGVQWRQVSVEGPGVRNHHAMVYDAARGVVVLFGGQDRAFAAQRDTWEWDGVSWTRVATTGPPARVHHAMVYDDARQRVLLYGGVNTAGERGDFWEWDGAAWRQIAATGPGPRAAHRMAFHSGQGKAYLVGGQEGDATVWTWDGIRWARMSGPEPTGRVVHAMAYDALRRTLIVFGGYRNNENLNDTWELLDDRWVLVDPGH